MRPSAVPNNVLRLMSAEDRKRLGKAGMTTEEAAAMAEAKEEKVLQQMIANCLLRMGIEFNASRMDKKTTCRTGWPDFVFALRDSIGRGVPCAIEVKTKTGRLTTEQQDILRRLAANGWQTAVIRSYDEFLQFLRDKCE